MDTHLRNEASLMLLITENDTTQKNMDIEIELKVNAKHWTLNMKKF